MALPDISTSETRITGISVQNNNHTRRTKIKSYFLTIRKHQVKDYVDINDLLRIIEYLKTKFPSLAMGTNSFEVDNKYKQLHFHGIIEISEPFYYKGNTSFGGFRLYWRPLYNKNKLIKYITKDIFHPCQQDRIISNNYYLHKCAPSRFIN